MVPAAHLKAMPPDSRFPPNAPEPIFNAPMLPLLLALSMPVLFFFQLGLSDLGSRHAMRPATLPEGWSGLVTSLLLHAGWVHAGMNAIGALAFGAPIARLLVGARGAGLFLLFYIGCGVVGGLGFALFHLGSYDPVVGASGAVFGLIGGATRLSGRRGEVAPLTDRRVLTMAAAWMGINAFTGLIGFAPGAEGARIAWEAHAFGFVAGILMIGPIVAAFGRPPSSFDSPDGLSDPAV